MAPHPILLGIFKEPTPNFERQCPTGEDIVRYWMWACENSGPLSPSNMVVVALMEHWRNQGKDVIEKKNVVTKVNRVISEAEKLKHNSYSFKKDLQGWATRTLQKPKFRKVVDIEKKSATKVKN